MIERLARRLGTRTTAILWTAVATLWAADALGCSCVTVQPDAERKRTALVFIGRAADVQRDVTGRETVSWEVLQSWSRRAPRIMITSSTTAEVVAATRPSPDGFT